MHGPVAILLVVICRCSRISLLKEKGNYPLFDNLTSEVSTILCSNEKKNLQLRRLSSCKSPSSVVSPASLKASLRRGRVRTSRRGLREAAPAVWSASGSVASGFNPRE